MLPSSDVRALVWSSLEVVLGARLPDARIDECVLVGEGLLSSLELVAVLIELEERLAAHGRAVLLAESRAMSARRSPFRTVGSLIDYIIARCGG